MHYVSLCFIIVSLCHAAYILRPFATPFSIPLSPSTCSRSSVVPPVPLAPSPPHAPLGISKKTANVVVQQCSTFAHLPLSSSSLVHRPYVSVAVADIVAIVLNVNVNVVYSRTFCCVIFSPSMRTSDVAAAWKVEIVCRSNTACKACRLLPGMQTRTLAIEASHAGAQQHFHLDSRPRHTAGALVG